MQPPAPFQVQGGFFLTWCLNVAGVSPNPGYSTETQVTDKIRCMATINPNQPPEPPIVPPRRESGGAVVLERRTERVKPPSMYQVLMLNDDYTPMEFVVVVIQEFFSKDLSAATQIMLKIHLDGRGVCGVYPKDIAATKVDQVLEAAHKAGHPLKCISESVDL